MNDTILLENLNNTCNIEDDILNISTCSCPICLDILNINDKIMISNGCECECIYHDKCFLEWYLKNRTCPICRETIPIQNINSFMYNIEKKIWNSFGYDTGYYSRNINQKDRFIKNFVCIVSCILCIIGSILSIVYFLRKYYEAPNIY